MSKNSKNNISASSEIKNDCEVKNKILFVIILTILTMAAEIFFGFTTKSMALLADGFHMGSHAFALGLTYIAYYFCAKLINCNKLKSGTGKIKELAGYTSSLFLGVSGIGIVFESVQRIFHPLQISVNEAIVVVIIGLLINFLSIIIMDFDHFHNHLHNHPHVHTEAQKDNSFKSAYMHILADLLTSVCAIFALLCAKFFNWTFLDPFIGVIGGIIILKWAYGLIKSTGAKLLDIEE